MLLNAVRAAKGYPLQFSKVTSYTGQGTVDGGLTLDLPFVLNTFGSPNPARILGSAESSAAFRTGVSQLQLADLNTAEIQRKLRTQVTARNFAYYRSQGWQKSLVNTILIEELYLEQTLLERLLEASDRACAVEDFATDRAKQQLRCRWRRQALTACRDDIDPRRRARRSASLTGGVVITYANDPRQYCQYVAFQWFFASIDVLDAVSLDLDAELTVDADECTTKWAPPGDSDREKAGAKRSKSKGSRREKEEDNQLTEGVRDGKVSVDIGVNVKVSDKKGDEESDRKERERERIVLNIPRELSPRVKTTDAYVLYDRIERLRYEQLCLLKVGKFPIRIIWRSPERMVRYLGDLLAVQALGAGNSREPVQVLSDDGKLVDLFRVERGRDERGSAAVSVEGPEGEKFSIPRSGPAGRAHLSLQAMALVMDSFNQAVSGKELPQPATFFLSGG